MNTSLRERRIGPIRERVNVHSPIEYSLNIAVGWTGITLGLLSALWIGMWAFNGPMPAPDGFTHYDDLPRRLLRLAHIAAVAVGVLNILIGRELPRLPIPPGWKRACSRLAAAAWPGLALVLAAAAFCEPLKFLLPVGACALTAACAIAAAGACREAFGGKP